MNTLQQTTHSYTGSNPANRTRTTTNGDHCPICGQPIVAIVARAPAVHEARPCGHEISTGGQTLRTREAVVDRDDDTDLLGETQRQSLFEVVSSAYSEDVAALTQEFADAAGGEEV